MALVQGNSKALNKDGVQLHSSQLKPAIVFCVAAFVLFLAAFDSSTGAIAGDKANPVKNAASAGRKPGAPGSVFHDCPAGDAFCPLMVVLPAGEFTMGENKGRHWRSSSMPKRVVKIDYAFAVSKYEVSFAQWDACVARNGCPHATDLANWGRGQRPVINLTWHEAQKYVAWLSRVTGQRYGLLSEAEWEYAARAGSDTLYPWGDGVGRNRANCDGCGSPWDGKSTAPIGRFPANAFGLHDMIGNVDEWVADPWHDNYKGAPSDGSVWRSGGNQNRRILRGGGYHVEPAAVDVSVRIGVKIDAKLGGLRVARKIQP